MSLANDGRRMLAAGKFISFPSFITTESLLVVLSLGNNNQWDAVFLKGKIYAGVAPVVLKIKKVNVPFSSVWYPS